MSDEVAALRAEIVALRAKVEALEARPPMTYRGVWRAGLHPENSAVTSDGSLWIAMVPTEQKPGTDDSGWRLAVKSGRNGRDVDDRWVAKFDKCLGAVEEGIGSLNERVALLERGKNHRFTSIEKWIGTIEAQIRRNGHV
jgi:hypothetical protein